MPAMSGMTKPKAMGGHKGSMKRVPRAKGVKRPPIKTDGRPKSFSGTKLGSRGKSSGR